MTTTRHPRPRDRDGAPAPAGSGPGPAQRLPDTGVVVGVDAGRDPVPPTGPASGRPVGAPAWAAAEAATSGHGLLLLAACRPDAPLPPTFGDQATPYVEPDRVRATAELERLARAMREGRDGPARGAPAVTTAVVPGRAAEVILTSGREARLVVVGQRRLGAVRRWAEGSTSLTVASRSPVPVVVVPDDWPLPGDHDTTDPVAVGVDLRPGDLRSGPAGAPGRHVRHPRLERAAASIAVAASFASRRGVALRVVSTWDAPEEIGWATTYRIVTDERRTADLHDWLAGLRAVPPDLEVRVEVSTGRASEHLLAAAATSGLTVIGRRSGVLGPAGPRLGAVARALLRHTPAPVAVVPHHDGG
ncbi:hypothetical protein GCM10009737_14890 [Nocardioides lentus]|uniref:UspA domain-containing protein n=1 Tax=Nocardioides lentus TaxID=338077 RepID=A0ABP5AKS6_9ACTN